MKNRSFQMIIALVLMAFSGFSQRPTIQLTFSAKYQSQYVMLDSIYIQNLSQPGDTMLFAPDTVLFLDYVSGIHDFGGTAKTSFSVSPNYPNPSLDGKTSIDMFIPEREIVTMRVFNIIGNEVAFYENSLLAGNHHFTFLAGKDRYYVLSVNCGNEIRSVKMINSCKSNQEQGTLIYEGSTETEPSMKSQEAITGFDFSLGDQLQYTAFASGYQASVIVDIPESSKTYTFEMVSSVFTCGNSITLNHVTGEVAPVDKTVTYSTITNIPGEPSKCWITSNLGADQQATAKDDATEASAGWYWQFNRKQGYKHDGTARTPNTAWITNIEENSDWIPINDPCAIELGNDWRIPTSTEWQNVDVNGNWADWNGPWNSGLKLHAAGLLGNNDGFLYDRGSSGLYWSNNQYSTTDGSSIHFSNGFSSMFNFQKAGGFPLRCIKNEGTSTIPVVTTAGITEIGQTTATGGGDISDDGGNEVTARGVCWSTSQNPTIADSHTSDGTGTGVFVSNITGLTPNAPYFVRAYAINSVGTAYGNEVTFTTSSAGFTCGDVVSYSGDNYNTVLIGTQCLFKENLKTTTYQNGMPIPNVTDPGTWQNLTSGAYVWYDNDISWKDKYGALYNWYTTVDPNGLCPTGWHVPTNAEWTILTDFIGGAGSPHGNELKSCRQVNSPLGGDCNTTEHPRWNEHNTHYGTDNYGFSGFPGGYCSFYGVFSYFGYFGYWWSSTEYTPSSAWVRDLYFSDGFVFEDDANQHYGFSVRCLKDTLNVPTVTTSAITNITQTTATGGGEVISDGDAIVSARGVCWSTSQNPTITDNHTSDGTGTGVFVSNLTGLTPNTAYFVRAYATNSVGTAYGNEVNFTTLYGGFPCGSSITINHIAGEVAPVDKTVTYNTASNIPGEPLKCWITSNLGADRQAITVDDDTEESAGWYWQFNRKQGYKHDGFNRIPNTTWINNINENSNWIPENDPCSIELGTGWRLPTSTEWYNVDFVGGWDNWYGPWNSQLKIHATGFLATWNNGMLYHRGDTGDYWSIIQDSYDYAKGLHIESSESKWFVLYKAAGFSVRCINQICTQTVPTVITSEISDITLTTASGGGEVTNNGGYEIINRGLCWSILPNPTLDESHTSMGPGTGSFISNIDGLQPNTSYFIKAYAINSLGVGYGEQLVFTTLANGSVCGEIVNYEGKDYNTLAIGGQCWFKENLDVGIMINYPQNQLNNGIIEKYCGYNESSNCELYGGLYRWDEMMNYQPVTQQQGICPDGWHVPSDIDLSILKNFVSLHPDFLCDDNPVNIAKSLAGATNWYTSVTNCTVGKDLSSNNSTNFSGLPGGAQNYEFFEGPGSNLYLWSSTENLLSESWFYSLDSYDSVMHRDSYNKNTGRSVRCLKNQSIAPFLQVVTTNIIDTTEYSAIGGGEIISTGGFAITERGVCWSVYENPTIYDGHTNDGTGSGVFSSNLTGLIPNTDYYVRAYAINSLGITYGNEISFTTLPGLFTCGDSIDYYGQKYYTVQIGSQCWFKDNLNMGEFINGSISQTNNNIFEKHCYDNQESNCEVYGGLYQWDEMMQYTAQPGAQGICPNDWHVPSMDEFTLLFDYLGGPNVSGGAMKETGTLHWLPPNTGATNSSGFTGLPGGVSKGSQSCFDLGAIGYYWSSTENNDWAYYGYLTFDSALGTTNGITTEYGISVRCLKD